MDLLYKREKYHPSGVEMTIFFPKNCKKRPDFYLREAYKYYLWIEVHPFSFLKKFCLHAWLLEGV